MSKSIYPGDIRYYNLQTPYYPESDVALPFETAMTVDSNKYLKMIATFEKRRPGVAQMACDPQTFAWLEEIVAGSGVDRCALTPFIRGRKRLAELVKEHNEAFDLERFERWKASRGEEPSSAEYPEFEHFVYAKYLGWEEETPFATGGSPDDIVNVGRHRGETLREMIANDPGYFEWMVLRNGNFALDDHHHGELEALCPGHPFLLETRLVMAHKNEVWDGIERQMIAAEMNAEHNKRRYYDMYGESYSSTSCMRCDMDPCCCSDPF